MNIAILSNINMEPLKSQLTDDVCYFCGYGQFNQELLDSTSMLYTREFDMVLIHLEGEEFVKEMMQTLTTTQEGCQILDDKMNIILNGVIQYAQQHRKTKIIISTVVLPPLTYLNYMEGNSIYSLTALEGRINERILAFVSSQSQVYVLDWRAIVMERGYQATVDEKFWYLGRIRYKRDAFKALAQAACNINRAINGKSKKVLVLDLDNTLWGGVVGEEGVGGIALSEDGIGKAYRDFQQTIKSLMHLGVMIAVISKNNQQDADEVFEQHPMMIIKKQDLVASRVNWESKSENMLAIAQELNVGVESFVFIDDDPRERALIREQLPQVYVPDFPNDPAMLRTWFLQEVVYTQFPRVLITEEDIYKTKQYQSHAKRSALEQGMDKEAFIRDLGINIDFYVNDARFIQRTAQLTQKTNQFNFTNRRYTKEDIEGFMASEDVMVCNADYRDRFGYEGIIAAAIIKIKDNVGVIDVFLMSCRVIGKRVEDVFWQNIIDALRGRNIHKVAVTFCSTDKNSIAQGFYQRVKGVT